MSKELGEKLRNLRLSAGFTQGQIARRLSVDRSTYSNYERAVTEPDIKALKKLAQIFDVDFNSLLSQETTAKVADTESDSTETYKMPSLEKQCVIDFRLLTAEQKEKALAFMENMLKDQQ